MEANVPFQKKQIFIPEMISQIPLMVASRTYQRVWFQFTRLLKIVIAMCFPFAAFGDWNVCEKKKATDVRPRSNLINK